MIKIGLISISDERQRVHEKLTPLIQQHTHLIASIIQTIPGLELSVEYEPINTPSKARSVGRRLAAEGVQATVFSLPTFGFPRLGVLAALFAPGPYLLVAQADPSQPTPAGVLGIGGAMTQLGITHERLWGDLESAEVRTAITRFVSAASAKARLRGQVMGLIGGRSMGLYPMVASSVEWMKKFAVDVDHLDEAEILRLSREVPASKVHIALKWLEEYSNGILYDNKILTREKLESQIRCYEATRAIIESHEMDFIAIKCHYDMSEYNVPQCLSIMLLNDPYDWDGPKEPVVCACEADQDGALTMQILKLLSSKPVCLLDFRYYDRMHDYYLFQNCGAAPSWFANHSNTPMENLRDVTICPCVEKWAGGGAHIRFSFREGVYTLARLYQETDGYHMIIMSAQGIGPATDNSSLGETNWPKAIMRISTSSEDIINRLNCVHVHAIAGDYVNELTTLCRFMNIKSEIITSGNYKGGI